MIKYLAALFAVCILFTNYAFADDPNREASHFYDEILKKSNYETEKYNSPAGSRELNLFGLNKVGQYNLNAVASPDFQYIAYSEVYFYPKERQTSGAIYIIEPSAGIDKVKALLTLSTKDKKQEPVIETRFNKLNPYKFNTFTIVDWNRTSDKLLIKEYLGENYSAIYGVKLYIYDFSSDKLISLNKLRDVVTDYYLANKNLYLEDYNWRIIPLGFGSANENKVFAEVYTYRNQSPVFMGLWSVSTDGNSVELVSLEKKNVNISANGISIKFKRDLEDIIKEQKEIDAKKIPYLVPARSK